MSTQVDHLITGSADGFLRIFHINPAITSEESFDSTESLLSSYIDSDTLTMAKDELIAITDLTYPLDTASISSLFFASVSDHSIHLYQHTSDSFTLYQTLTAPKAAISSLGYIANNLIVLSLDGMIRCYDSSNFHHIFCHETPSNMLAMCFHKSYIYIGGSDYCIHCYEYNQTSIHHVSNIIFLLF